MKFPEKKVAIITGAGSGIGKAAALLLSKEVAKVVVSDIERMEMQAVEEIREAGGEAFFVKADSSKPDDHKMLVEQTPKKYGAFGITVNNAGIGGHWAATGAKIMNAISETQTPKRFHATICD